MSSDRYLRQIQLPEFGPAAQQKLCEASVLVVGVGGLGIPVLQYLNAMGVGTLGMVDQDVVEKTNLHRQLIFEENQTGLSKVKLAAEVLRKQNSDTHLILHDTFLVRNNALEIIQDYDLVVDASDNFAARYLVNDACVILNKPFVYGALHGFEGHVSVFNFNGGPTYRCIFPTMPSPFEVPNCEEQGVLGVLPGIIGNFQALEAIKLIAGVGDVLSGKLLLYNGLECSMRKINIPVLAENLSIRNLADRYEHLLCDPAVVINAEALNVLLQEKEPLQLIDVRSPEEFNEYRFENAQNIPLDEIPQRTSELDPRMPVYFICQSGSRSLQALQWMKKNNIQTQMYHLVGGIDAFRIHSG
jgi:adenylyltransferase/sulfurtransferase